MPFAKKNTQTNKTVFKRKWMQPNVTKERGAK